ncbi:hypothetical protein KFK09_003896 [Dendrobium nobile]|uniref:Uncharacterized protein n=1 Tax=Dendrobium nobile TaxID=94219 RepID=A0A8T3BYU3_DENNO|nr:hypothetical protein KFK09_003896 [Dendrobium nobile]
MAGGDRRSPPRSSGGAGDGTAGGEERRRSGVGSGGSKKQGDRSGAGSPSKPAMAKTRGKAREATRSGSEGSVEGRWEVKPRNMNPKGILQIGKNGSDQNKADGARREDPHPREMMELESKSGVSMKLNPMYIASASSMEVEDTALTEDSVRRWKKHLT